MNRNLLAVATAVIVGCFGIPTANATSVTTLTLQTTTFVEPIAVGARAGAIIEGPQTSFVGSDGGSVDLSPLLNDVPAPFTILLGSCPTILDSGTSCTMQAAELNTAVAGTYDDVLTLDFTYTPASGPTQILPVTYTLDATVGTPDPVPLPASLSLFAGGLGALGLLRWRRKRKVQAVA